MSACVWTTVRVKVPNSFEAHGDLSLAVAILTDHIAEPEVDEGDDVSILSFEGDCNYGLNDDVHEALSLFMRNGCPFHATNDGYDGEWAGWWLHWKAPMPLIEGGEFNGQAPTISADDIFDVLENGTPEQVVARVRELLWLDGQWIVEDAEIIDPPWETCPKCSGGRGGTPHGG